MKKGLLVFLAVLVLVVVAGSVQAVPLPPPTTFIYYTPMKVYDETAVSWFARLDSMLAHVSVSGTFTPDTASINHSNKILEYGVNRKLSSVDSTLASLYAQAAGAQSRDSTIQATNLPSLPLLYTQAAGAQSRDSTLLVLIVNWTTRAESLLAANAPLDTTGLGATLAVMDNIYNKSATPGDTTGTGMAIIAGLLQMNSITQTLWVKGERLDSLMALMYADMEAIKNQTATTHIEGCDVLDSLTVGGGTINISLAPWTSGPYDQKTLYIDRTSTDALGAADSIYVLSSPDPTVSGADAYADSASLGFALGSEKHKAIVLPIAHIPYCRLMYVQSQAATGKVAYRSRICGKSNTGE